MKSSMADRKEAGLRIAFLVEGDVVRIEGSAIGRP
jgi:hypothetical protein